MSPMFITQLVATVIFWLVLLLGFPMLIAYTFFPIQNKVERVLTGNGKIVLPKIEAKVNTTVKTIIADALQIPLSLKRYNVHISDGTTTLMIPNVLAGGDLYFDDKGVFHYYAKDTLVFTSASFSGDLYFSKKSQFKVYTTPYLPTLVAKYILVFLFWNLFLSPWLTIIHSIKGSFSFLFH